MKFFQVLLSAVLLLPAVVHAQNINLLPEGQTLVTLSVTESVTVEQDLLIASLRIESDDRDARTVQERINSLMEEAVELARAVPEVKVATGYYSVYQYTNQPQAGRAGNFWRGTQSLTLESKDADKLLELTGKLQDMGLLMNQLSYQLSPERANEVRDGLLESAITRARAQVERAGAALGKTDIDIAVLDVDSALSYDNPIMLRAARAADTMEMSAPVAEAGESTVSLTVRVQAVAR